MMHDNLNPTNLQYEFYLKGFALPEDAQSSLDSYYYRNRTRYFYISRGITSFYSCNITNELVY